jgi:hypothetical protein
MQGDREKRSARLIIRAVSAVPDTWWLWLLTGLLVYVTVRSPATSAFLVSGVGHAVLATALGSSLLTGLASLGVVRYQEQLRREDGARNSQYAAIMELLTRSYAVSSRAHVIAATIKVRFGLKGWRSFVTHHPGSLDPSKPYDWMAQDVGLLTAALSEVHTRCDDDEDGYQLAKAVFERCMDLLGVSAANRSQWIVKERVARWVIGRSWTPRMLDEHEISLKNLVDAQNQLANYARALLENRPAWHLAIGRFHGLR